MRCGYRARRADAQWRDEWQLDADADCGAADRCLVAR